MKEFLMPSLGADMEDGTLVEWRKKPGDLVNRGDIIAEVDTQKGLIEIEIFEDGYIDKFLINPGEKVPVGKAMARIKIGDADKEPEKQKTAEQPTEEYFSDEKTIPSKISKKRIKASPLAKKIAKENQIDLSTLTGTGENGTIHKEDVINAIEKRIVQKTKKTVLETLPEKEPEKIADSGEAIRVAIAAAMSKSNREIPHYYLSKKIDMSKSLSWLKETNMKISVKERLLPAALLIKAVARSLDEVPQLNAVWENALKIKNEINIGFVISLRSGGIIVPSINNADLKSILEIMDSLNDLIPRARAMKLRSSELNSSTITLTNLGEGGADTLLGVIYPPQVAIIGFGGITEEVWVENGMMGIRSVITASLSGDHRATDGLTGNRFLKTLNNNLQHPENL